LHKRSPCGLIGAQNQQNDTMTSGASGSDVFEGAARLRTSPQFPAAMHLFAALYPETFNNNFIFTRIATEDVRQIIGIYMWRSHFLRDFNDPNSGVTVSGTQAFCAERGLAGHNRVAALLTLMRHGGFLIPAPASPDRRVKRFEPSPKAYAITRELFSAFLRPLSLLTQDQTYLDRLSANDDLMRDIFVAGFDFYMQHGFLVDAIPALKLFVSRNAGFEIMLKLVTAPPAGGGLDPHIVTFPYAEIAQYLTVSRVHVRRLVEDAEQDGYLDILEQGGRLIALKPSLLDLAERAVALDLAWVWQGTQVAQTGQQA
jgi:hypothetical protein